MQSFRTELENSFVEKDIIDLEKKIRLFRGGKLNEEKFRSLRLARGVYGQRQQGVQMVRIKLPYGKMTVKQLLKISDISDEYATKNLHLTTRQDIQIHYVSLDRIPELWAKLEQDDITLREACGNTVRNVTASSTSGIDPDEPFDVSPYAHATFKYFLRNPICQDMGRKFKIAFSSSDKDTALTCMHDMGFVPKIKRENGKEIRGFKVLVGGGLGAQPFLAKVAHEFLHEDLIVPFTESVLRVFDRYGERTNRGKARIKFLINKLGFDEVIRLANEEHKALKTKEYKIDSASYPETIAPTKIYDAVAEIKNKEKYDAWFKTNTFEQKQKGFFGVYIKIQTGDLKTEDARKIAVIAKKYAADDIRITINQDLLLKFIRQEWLPNVYNELDAIGYAEPGYDSTADITACPGTDTCNLGISSSTGIAAKLERVIKEEYPELIYNSDIKIKISGCMNSCGQHAIANIGFQGSSLRSGMNVLPAMQVLLGGGTLGDGNGRVADKVIKVPSKKGPQVLRTLLDDFENNAVEGEYFNSYFDRVGKDYFYKLLRPLADLTHLEANDFVDWGHEVKYESAIGIGECAGVVIDLVATLLYEAEEKMEWAKASFKGSQFADSIYHTYNVFVSTAKALLLDKQVSCNTQMGIINDFEKHYVAEKQFAFTPDFRTHVLQINQNEPTKEFAEKYLKSAEGFYEQSKVYRDKQLKSYQNNLTETKIDKIKAEG